MKRISISDCVTKRRGFTLMEFAIVLGVGGLILGGIWGAMSGGRENARQATLKNNINIIVRNIRSFAAGQNGVTGDYTTLTATLTGLTPPAVPADMMRPTGTGGCTVAKGCVDHPWGPTTTANITNGSMYFCAWDPNAVSCTTTSSQLFAINLQTLPVESCIKLALGNSGADGPPGLYDVVIQNVSMRAAGFPVKASTAKTNCAGGAAAVNLIYRVATPQS